MDRIQTYIQVLQGMDVPVLKKRSDIWTYFPVNSKPLGRGNNKADRHGIEWHGMNLRKISEATGMPVSAVQKAFMSPLLKALGSSPYWRLQDSNNDTYVAKIAMRFDVGTNNTRKVQNNAPPVVQYRRWNVTPAIAAPAVVAPMPVTNQGKNTRRNINTRKNGRKVVAKTQAELNENAFFVRMAERTNAQKAANNTTRRARMEKYIKQEPEHVRQIRAIANKLSADNQEKLIQELISVIPTSTAEFEESMAILVGLALDTQAYHPLFLEAILKLNATNGFPTKPSDALVRHYQARFEKAFADEGFLKPKTLAQKLNYRCFLLFAGYMYREGFMGWAVFKTILARMEELTHSEDKEIQNEAVLGLEFALIRGGKRMIAQGGEEGAEFVRLMDYLTQLSKSYPEPRIRFQILDFLDSVKADFIIRSADPWAVGAPSSNIRPLIPLVPGKPTGPIMETRPRVQDRAQGLGLGPDISELWRRFPLDVVQEEKGLWMVRFHRKKLAERFERERGKFPNQQAFMDALSRQIMGLLDASEIWARGPAVPGTLVTIIKK